MNAVALRPNFHSRIIIHNNSSEFNGDLQKSRQITYSSAVGTQWHMPVSVRSILYNVEEKNEYLEDDTRLSERRSHQITFHKASEEEAKDENKMANNWPCAFSLSEQSLGGKRASANQFIFGSFSLSQYIWLIWQVELNGFRTIDILCAPHWHRHFIITLLVRLLGNCFLLPLPRFMPGYEINIQHYSRHRLLMKCHFTAVLWVTRKITKQIERETSHDRANGT